MAGYCLFTTFDLSAYTSFRNGNIDVDKSIDTIIILIVVVIIFLLCEKFIFVIIERSLLITIRYKLVKMIKFFQII